VAQSKEVNGLHSELLDAFVRLIRLEIYRRHPELRPTDGVIGVKEPIEEVLSAYRDAPKPSRNRTRVRCIKGSNDIDALGIDDFRGCMDEANRQLKDMLRTFDSIPALVDAVTKLEGDEEARRVNPRYPRSTPEMDLLDTLFGTRPNKDEGAK